MPCSWKRTTETCQYTETILFSNPVSYLFKTKTRLCYLPFPTSFIFFKCFYNHFHIHNITVDPSFLIQINLSLTFLENSHHSCIETWEILFTTLKALNVAPSYHLLRVNMQMSSSLPNLLSNSHITSYHWLTSFHLIVLFVCIFFII